MVPELVDADFSFRVGTSLLEEFARSHSPADVLREVVQNEYDAGGASTEIEFGHGGLVISGTGKPIDPAGWRRLSVVLGTGLVGGSSERVAAKVNGVGSKNFGLRSLFLFGDRIYVSSRGRMSVLDRTAGALSRPVADPTTSGERGVVLRVPYRSTDDGPMRCFGIEQEKQAFAEFARELSPTLVKLTLPGTRPSLRSVVVRSARLGGELVWRQSHRRVDGRPNRLERTVRIGRRGLDIDGLAKSIREVEYSRDVTVPDRYKKRDIPSYFRTRGGRIRLALSFPVLRDTIDVDAAGIFYYPLGASRTRTGYPFSLCAPFEMNEDRSQLIDLGTSDWNAWLVDQCAQLAADLLTSDVFADFGARGYIAFDADRADTASVPELVDAVERRLKSEACWPTQPTGRTKRPVFQPAPSLTTPTPLELADVVENCLKASDVLDSTLSAEPRARRLANRHGVASFTVNSLVRMWCAGLDAHALATKPGTGEASRHYADYPAALRDLALQRRLAAALDAVRAELSDRHRTDLRRSAMVLSAARTLVPLGQLWRVDAALADAIPPGQRLHPRLADFDVVRRLTRPFNASRWVIETSEKLGGGEASEPEQVALARLLRDGPPLSAKAWSAARRAPVLRDHRGDWVAPADLVSRRAPNAGLLASAVRHPKPDDERNPRLAKLRIRTDLEPGDLLALARLVEDRAEPPSAIGRAIARLPKLLTPSTVARLREIAFLETTTGALAPPHAVYERTERLAAALGEDAPFATGVQPKVLRQLRCPTVPPVEDVVSELLRRRDREEPLPRPDLVYRVLVEAARAERRRPDEHREQPILWTGAKWEAPVDCLVGSDNAALFRDAVTVVPSHLAEQCRALGVPAKPAPSHWRRLLEWAGDQHGSDQLVPARAGARLSRAYRLLDAPPDGLAASTACLLDENRRLHTSSEARQGRLAIDDDPTLATAARSAGVPVAFVPADDPGTYPFLRACGVRPLSALARHEGVSCGEPVDAARGVPVASALSRLHRPELASALRALVSTTRAADLAGPRDQIADRLAAVDRIALVEHVTRRYRLHDTLVDVSAEYALEPGQILLAHPRTAHEFWEQLSAAVAALADPSDVGEQALRDPVYFLLRCSTSSELRRELARRKVAWQPDWQGWAGAEEEAGDDGADDGPAADLDPASLIAEMVGRAATAEHPSADRTATGLGGGGSATPRTPRGPLPDLADVEPLVLADSSSTGSRAAWPSGGGTRTPSWWTPREDRDHEEDRELGRRAEELVLDRLRQQLAAAGRPPELVVWVADTEPFADHDIRTVDPDGHTVWVEVKGSTGRHGRFRWPRAEFRLALRERDRYLLYRVYEAHTLHPVLREVRDPVGRFQVGDVDLDLDSLAGDVGPAG